MNAGPPRSWIVRVGLVVIVGLLVGSAAIGGTGPEFWITLTLVTLSSGAVVARAWARRRAAHESATRRQASGLEGLFQQAHEQFQRQDEAARSDESK